MRISFIFAFLFLAVSVEAYFVTTVTPAQPFAPVAIENPEEELQRTFLGSLTGYPDMLEFTLTGTSSLAISLWQRPQEIDTLFGFIIVKVNDDGRGVVEVARAQQQTVEWIPTRVQVLGVTLRTSEVVAVTLDPGQYRLEVSTPTNEGSYALRLMEATDASYFESIGGAYATLQHFSYNPLRIIGSPYVYYPLGIVLLVGGIFFTWRYRKRLSHAT